jgi:hypothetical protein
LVPDKTDRPPPARKASGQLLPNRAPLPGAGRPKGSQNKKTITMLEMLRAAAAARGSDGKGLGGEQGFIDAVAERDPVFLAAALIRATIPAAKAD